MAFQKMSDSELEVRLVELQNVIKSRDNMHDNIDKVLLRRYLKFYNGNVDKALKRLITSMELRKSYPKIFYNRDTLDPQLRKLIELVEMAFLPKLTADNHRVLIMRLIDYDSSQLIFDDAITVFSLVHDTSMITPDEGSLADGEIMIFDVKGLTAGHLARIGLSTLRCFLKYVSECHPIRIKEVHVLNSSSLLDKLFMIMRPFLGAKAMKVIHFHLPNATTLYDHISRDVLPEEYGGSGESIQVSKWYWIHRTEDHREYLLDDDRWKIITKNTKDEDLDDEAFSYLGLC